MARRWAWLEEGMSENSSWNDFNRKLIEEFRANGGKVSGQFAGAPLLLLTSTGRKSGRQVTNPLVYTTDGDRVVIMASKGGMPSNPDWFYNVQANPQVDVEIGQDSFRANARVAEGEERERLFRAHADFMPQFDEYQKNTARVIPVVVLERAS